MAEYIEREALIKRLEVTPILKYGIPTHVRDGVIDLVEKQPAADVVEVVRCEDCGYSIEDGFWCKGCGLMPGHATLPNKWCDEGERDDSGARMDGD